MRLDTYLGTKKIFHCFDVVVRLFLNALDVRRVLDRKLCSKKPCITTKAKLERHNIVSPNAYSNLRQLI